MRSSTLHGSLQEVPGGQASLRCVASIKSKTLDRVQADNLAGVKLATRRLNPCGENIPGVYVYAFIELQILQVSASLLQPKMVSNPW